MGLTDGSFPWQAQSRRRQLCLSQISCSAWVCSTVLCLGLLHCALLGFAPLCSASHIGFVLLCFPLLFSSSRFKIFCLALLQGLPLIPSLLCLSRNARLPVPLYMVMYLPHSPDFNIFSTYSIMIDLTIEPK